MEWHDEDLRIAVTRQMGTEAPSVSVQITHMPSGFTVTVDDEATMLANKAKALRLLRLQVEALRD